MNTSIQTRVPRGCDYQGRYPQAAEACTEVGAEDIQRNAKPLFSYIADLWRADGRQENDCAWVYAVPIAVLLIIGAVSAALWPY